MQMQSTQILYNVVSRLTPVSKPFHFNCSLKCHFEGAMQLQKPFSLKPSNQINTPLISKTHLTSSANILTLLWPPPITRTVTSNVSDVQWKLCDNRKMRLTREHVSSTVLCSRITCWKQVIPWIIEQQSHPLMDKAEAKLDDAILQVIGIRECEVLE